MAGAAAAAGTPSGPEPDLEARKRALIRVADPREQLAGARALAAAYEARGRLLDAADTLRLALRDAIELRDPATTALADQAVALCETAADAACEADALFNLGAMDIDAGHLDIALARLTRAMGLFRKVNDLRGAAETRFNASSVRLQLGDAAGALRDLRDVESSFREQGGDLAIYFDLALAEVEIEAGDPAAALAAALRARAALGEPRAHPATEFIETDPRARAESLAGRAYARLGRGPEALAADARAHALAHAPIDIFQTTMLHARTLVDLGRPLEAVPTITQLLATITVAGPIDARDVHRLAARVFKATGRLPAALRETEAAADLDARLHGASLAEAVAASETSIALAERRAETERLARRRDIERVEAAGTLARTRLAAVLTVAGLLVAAGLGAALWRVRERRARETARAHERARVTADIHDTLLQDFAGLAMQLRAAARTAAGEPAPATALRLEDIVIQANRSLAEARHAMLRIRLPAEHDPADLAGAVARWLAAQRPPTGVELTLDAEPDLPPLDPERAEEVGRVLREAVTNALRHSHSPRVGVIMRARDRRIEATVWDQGRGFDVAEAGHQAPAHWGLALMRERIDRIGGELRINSAPGAGTVITAFVPC